ncbi:MAG TPA: aminopeptidase, partial [Clostridiales bacterium]|nr:aminopeptidase [Clostridiales bacterium]
MYYYRGVKMKNATEMTFEKIRKYKEEYDNNKQANFLANAINKSGIDAIAFNNEALRKMQYNFSVEIETGKITNQKGSGRCWIFAGLNTMRFHIGKKFNIKDFELSQNYVAFWDKFEKANYFLETMIDTLDQETGSREIMWLIQNMVSDGGQWDMFCNIVEKYGIVPKEAMPETTPSSSSAQMNKFLQIKLREFAATLRSMYQDGSPVSDLSAKKDQMMAEIYKMLCMFLGQPPESFDFEYRDKDKKFFADRNMTPMDF